ncbi:MAG: mercury transporter MerT [Deltaproteobacteria bacterium]|nr:mercury transporter MerT [Deltaproteobacteria bacterium]
MSQATTKETTQACTVPSAPSPRVETPDDRGRWSIAANAGAILSAFVASACCVGPLVFALLGLGGGALLVKLEPYRPFFIALTFALLGSGFYFTYRKPKASSADEACGCPAPGTNRVGRIMLWTATALVVGFLSFPYVAPLVFS